MGTTLLGGEDKGGSQVSGRALRMKMISPLAKVKRLAMYFQPVILKTIKLLGQLNNIDLSDVSMTWQDGLPNDPVEEAEIMKIRTVDKPTMSQKRAIMQYDNMNEVQAEEELALIQEEEAQNEVSFSPPFSDDNRIDVDG
jgi:hypothetical protein